MTLREQIAVKISWGLNRVDINDDESIQDIAFTVADRILKLVGWHPETEKPPIGLVVSSKFCVDSLEETIVWTGKEWKHPGNTFMPAIKPQVWRYLPPEDE